MTPANVTRLKQIAIEFSAIATAQNRSAQEQILAISTTEGLVRSVLLDLVLRPEVNSEGKD